MSFLLSAEPLSKPHLESYGPARKQALMQIKADIALTFRHVRFWHQADNHAPAFVRYWTKADKAEFLPEDRLSAYAQRRADKLQRLRLIQPWLNVRFWHLADIHLTPINVRFRG